MSKKIDSSRCVCGCVCMYEDSGGSDEGVGVWVCVRVCMKIVV